MANKLHNEEEIFEIIQKTKNPITHKLWDFIYSIIDSKITIMDLLFNLHIEQNEPIPKSDLVLILEHLDHLTKTFNNIHNPTKILSEDKTFFPFKEDIINISKEVQDILNHYIGNDIQAINFIVGLYADELEEESMPVEKQKKALNYVVALKDILNKLRIATKRD